MPELITNFTPLSKLMFKRENEGSIRENASIHNAQVMKASHSSIENSLLGFSNIIFEISILFCFQLSVLIK